MKCLHPVSKFVFLVGLGSIVVLTSNTSKANDWQAGKTVSHWQAFRNLTSAEFSKKFKTLKDQKMQLVDFEFAGGKYSGLWIQNHGAGGYTYRDLSNAEFGRQWKKLKKKGFYPVDIEAYQKGKNLKYSAVWRKVKKGQKWLSFRNLSSKDFAKEYKKLAPKYIPVDFEAYPTSKGLRYAMVWQQNTAKIKWRLNRNLTDKAFSKKHYERLRQGYQLVDLEVYQRGEKQYFAGIWVKTRTHRFHLVKDLTDVMFFNTFGEMVDGGYRLTDIEQYRKDGKWLYAGLWRENGLRSRWRHAAAVTKRVKQYRKKNNLPGVSVAILQKGRMVYRRGFGFADVEAGIRASGDTVYLTASISKAIGATLALRLLEKNKKLFSLKKPIRQYLPELPKWHKYTLFDVLTHTSCVRDHLPGKADIDQQFDSQLKAAETFWNDALICKAPSKPDRYSTPAFTILGALLEKRTGKRVRDLIRVHITERLNLLSLRAQYPLTSNRRRAALYRIANPKKHPHPKTNQNVKAHAVNNSWKVLGGGIESSAVDLARFGQSIVDKRMVGSKLGLKLWYRQRNHRSLGWVGDSRKRYIAHSGEYTGAGSYLRVYKDGSLVIAMLSNRRHHRQDKRTALANDISKIIRTQ